MSVLSKENVLFGQNQRLSHTSAMPMIQPPTTQKYLPIAVKTPEILTAGKDKNALGFEPDISTLTNVETEAAKILDAALAIFDLEPVEPVGTKLAFDIKGCDLDTSVGETIGRIVSGVVFTVAPIYLSLISGAYALAAGKNIAASMRAGFKTFKLSEFEPEIIANFKEDLVEMSKNSDTRSFLTTILQDLSEGRHISLWDTAMKASSGDINEAVRMLAILFADTQSFSENMVSGSLSIIGKVRDLVADLSSEQLYPSSNISFPACSRLYHYYVIRYLIQKLMSEGIPESEACLGALAMNSEYEFAQSHFYGGLKTSAEDLYLGYRAVVDHLGKSPQTFDEFKQELTRNRFAWIKSLNLFD